jgi:cell division protein FtsL
VVRLPVRSAAGLLERLLRGRGWIALIGALLAGIVFLNVALLELNGGLAATSEQAAELRRENADLRSEVSRLSATARIRRLAEAEGLWMPEPAQVTYLQPEGRRDATAAARALEAPELAAPTEPAAPAPVEAVEPVPPELAE